MNENMLLDIGEVAQQSGVPVSTVRYYDEIGLIDSVARRGLRRQFEPNVLLQLTLISMGRVAGFSLEEIRGIFDIDGKPTLPRDELHAKADEIDLTVRRLTSLSQMLRHVANCPAPTHLECDQFQKLIQTAQRINKRRSGAN